MTTAETIRMYNALPRAAQLDVSNYIKRLFAIHKRAEQTTLAAKTKHVDFDDISMPPVTRQEFLTIIDESIAQSKHGKGVTLEELQKETALKYGIPV